MASLLGKAFKVTLNAVSPKVSRGWASPANKGFMRFLNGTQKQSGNIIRFQGGLKHAIVRTGYRDTLKQYHKLSTSAYADPKALLELKNNLPRTLHQSLIELSDLMSMGAKV